MAKRSRKVSTKRSKRPRRSKSSSRKTMKRTKRTKRQSSRKHTSKKSKKLKEKSVRKRKRTKKLMKGGGNPYYINSSTLEDAKNLLGNKPIGTYLVYTTHGYTEEYKKYGGRLDYFLIKKSLTEFENIRLSGHDLGLLNECFNECFNSRDCDYTKLKQSHDFRILSRIQFISYKPTGEDTHPPAPELQQPKSGRLLIPLDLHPPVLLSKPGPRRIPPKRLHKPQAPQTSLENLKYFYDGLNKSDAETRLSDIYIKKGDFLVRKSVDYPNMLILSVRATLDTEISIVIHFEIQEDAGKFKIDDSVKMDSVYDLINYYIINKKVLSEKSKITLNTPVNK